MTGAAQLLFSAVRQPLAVSWLTSLVLFVASLASAQNSPRLGYVYPAGGRQGSTFQVILGGQFLSGATNVCFSGPGVEARVGEYNRPLTQREFNMLRDQMRELQDRKVAATRHGPERGTNSWTAADDRKLTEIRRKLALSDPRKQTNPAIAETVALRVTLGTNASPGEFELRLQSATGLSNPLIFCVGQLPEFSKQSARSIRDTQAQNLFRGVSEGATPPTEMNITLPAIVNGQLMPGGVDRFRFRARAGQKLVMATAARRLIPFLADAVPGWFQATVGLYDGKGKEVAYADDFQFDPDPILFQEIEKEGEYVVEIKDSIYRGREDFVYRITIGALPYITGVFPLGGQAGRSTLVQLQGWNLDAKTFTITNGTAPGVRSVAVCSKDGITDSVPFAVDLLPECLEQSRERDCAQALALPVIVNGRINQTAERDVFSFKGTAGQEVVAEIVARRVGSPLDSVLRLTHADGRQLAFSDDHEDKSAGLITHQADSWLRAVLPADGKYFVQVADAQGHGGDRYAYRLRVSAPLPDFCLRAVPSSLSVRGGTSVPFTVYAVRRDGFAGEINVKLQDPPAGFSLSGGKVPAGCDRVQMTLNLASSAGAEVIGLSLEGDAIIAGNQVSRAVIPADDMMQAFSYRHLVPCRQLAVAVLGRGLPKSALKILSEMPLKIPAGGTARVEIAMPSGAWASRFQLELSEPPAGITVRGVTASRDSTTILLQSDAAKIKPGLKGNLIVQAFGKAGGAQKSSQRSRLGALPAIPFEVISQ